MVYDTALHHVGIGREFIKIDRRSRYLYRQAGRLPYLATLLRSLLGQIENALITPPGHLDKLRFSPLGHPDERYFRPWDSF